MRYVVIQDSGPVFDVLLIHCVQNAFRKLRSALGRFEPDPFQFIVISSPVLSAPRERLSRTR